MTRPAKIALPLLCTLAVIAVVLAARAEDRRTTQGLALYAALLFFSAMATVVADFYFRCTKDAVRGLRAKPPNVDAQTGAFGLSSTDQ